jgi:hypothetical protein
VTDQKHPENADELLELMIARSCALWGKERTEELQPKIEALRTHLLQLSSALPENEDEPAFLGW